MAQIRTILILGENKVREILSTPARLVNRIQEDEIKFPANHQVYLGLFEAGDRLFHDTITTVHVELHAEQANETR